MSKLVEDCQPKKVDFEKIPIDELNSILMNPNDTRRNEALYQDVTNLALMDYSISDIIFYKHWFVRIYVDKEFDRDALFGRVDDKFTWMQKDIIKSKLSRKIHT